MFLYNHPNYFNQHCLFKKRFCNQGLLYENITQTSRSFNASSCWGDPDRLDCLQVFLICLIDRRPGLLFYENYFFTNRWSKRSKLSHGYGALVLSRTQNSLTTNEAAKSNRLKSGLSVVHGRSPKICVHTVQQVFQGL